MQGQELVCEINPIKFLLHNPQLIQKKVRLLMTIKQNTHFQETASESSIRVIGHLLQQMKLLTKMANVWPDIGCSMYTARPHYSRGIF